jgi:hypothetical protein
MQAWRQALICPAAVLAQLDLRQGRGLQHHGELGFGRPVIGQFLISWHNGSFCLGLFAPSIQGHFADAFLGGYLGHGQVQRRQQLLQQGCFTFG